MIPVYIVTSYFPPVPSVATLRMASFAKYLDHTKFDIHVICPFDAQRNCNDLQEKYKIKVFQMPSKPRKIGYKAGERPLRHKLKTLANLLVGMIFIDNDPRFIEEAVKFITSTSQPTDRNILITSYAPLDCIKIGIKLKIQRPNIYWVSDLRDEITQNPHISHLVRLRMSAIESKMLKYADLITSVSLPILNYFRSKQAHHKKQTFIEIRNGFDFDIVKDPPPNPSTTFSISYAGSFYGSIKPDFFFKALEPLIEEFKDIQFSFNVIGNKAPFNTPKSLKKIVRSLPPVPYTKIPETLALADVLLMIHPMDGRKGVYTTKLFDYLAVNRPILALIDPSDVAAELIRKTNSGVIAQNENVEEIYAAIKRLIEEKIHDIKMQKNWAIIDQLSRQHQIAMLNQAIIHVLASP